MAENKINVGGRLHSIATGNILAGTDEILDDAKGKKQSEVNIDVDNALADRYTKDETYNKTELNNMITTPNQQYVSVMANSQTTDVTDVLPSTGAANTVYRVGNWDGSQFDASVYSEYAWNGSSYAHLSTKTKVGEVFDISAYHATGGTLATYADLEAALDSDNGGGVPQSLQEGGMEVKFVHTSDNNYVQFRYMGTAVTGTPNPFLDTANWQGVDDEPTLNSENLVKSGGVYNNFKEQSLRIGSTPIDFVKGYLVHIINVGETNPLTPEANAHYSYAIVDVNEGDIVDVSSQSSTSLGNWEIVDANNIVTRKHMGTSGVYIEKVTILSGEKKIVINNNVENNNLSYLTKVSSLETEIEKLKGANNTLQQAINTETQQRQSADSTLQQNIDKTNIRIGNFQIPFVDGYLIRCNYVGNEQNLIPESNASYRYAIVDVNTGDSLKIHAEASASLGEYITLDSNNVVVRRAGINGTIDDTVVIASNEKKVVINNRTNNDYVSILNSPNSIELKISDIEDDVDGIESDISDINSQLGVEGGEEIAFTTGYLIRCNYVGNEQNLTPESNNAYTYSIVNVNAKDKVKIHVYSSTAAGDYAVLDSNNIVTRRGSVDGEIDTEIEILEDEKKVIINNQSGNNYKSYIVKWNTIWSKCSYIDELKSGKRTTQIMYPDTIIVAASDSSDEDKKIANYVCTGEYDEVTINNAINDLVYGGTLQLCYGTYYVDNCERIIGSFFKCAIGMKDNGNFRHVIIQGNVMGSYVPGSTHAYKPPRIRVREACYNALDDNTQVAVIGCAQAQEWFNWRCAFTVKNLEISLPNCTKPVIGISHIHTAYGGCESVFVYNDVSAAYHINPTEDHAPTPNPLSIGILGHPSSNSNPYSKYAYCDVLGFAIGYEISGDHTIFENCWSGKNIIGYRLGNFAVLTHKNVLIGCISESDTQFMSFSEQNTTVIEPIQIIAFQFEQNPNRAPIGDAVIPNLVGNKKSATEGLPNTQWVGDITYAGAPIDTPFFEPGNGQLFKCRNMRNKLSGTTAQRPTNPDYLAEYFDTDLGRKVIWDGSNWV